MFTKISITCTKFIQYKTQLKIFYYNKTYGRQNIDYFYKLIFPQHEKLSQSRQEDISQKINRL